MSRFRAIVSTCLLAGAAGCSDGPPRQAAPSPARPVAPRLDVDAQGGTEKRGPGDLFNACERIWCLTHERNFDLDHFARDHVGWILHDDGSGDVFVAKHRSSGPAFPRARPNVLALCGQHIHPFWLGAREGPVTKTGFNVALGYDRAHFASYGTRLTRTYVNAEAWGFLHSATPREYRFGDRTTAREMAGSGWQKAISTRLTSASDAGGSRLKAQ